MTSRSRIVMAALMAAAGIVILCGLGLWQLQRLQWKEGLIHAIAERLQQPPRPLDDVGPDASADFVKVTLSGLYIPGNNRFVATTAEEGPAYQVVSPLALGDGRVVLIDRGVIPVSSLAAFEAAVPEGPVSLTGILRVTRDEPSYFAPDKDPEKPVWYWWDVPSIAASLQLGPDATVLPAVVQLLPQTGDASLPRPEPPSARLVNNHLQYAVTWFAFAAVLLVITALFIRQQMTKSAA